jgi:hypothetical protein
MLATAFVAAACAQTVKVENTGKVGRRVENRYYTADLSPRTVNARVEDSGTLRALTFKEFDVTFVRNPANGRMHKGPSIQRVGAPSYKDQGNWDPVQQFREERQGGVYIHHREGYFPGYPEVRVASEYRFPADAPYFIVSTVLAVEKPIRVSMVRNNEMTMDLFFTDLVWPGAGGAPRAVAFDDRRPILQKEPIPTDVPWMAFVHPERGYGYGFVNLGSKHTRTANADTAIADGYSGEGAQRALTGRYWSRHLIWEAQVDLVPGDRFEELTAYVLFHSSKKSPVGDFFEWEKRIRESSSAR